MKVNVAKLTQACVSLIIISLMFTSQSFAKIDPKTLVTLWPLDEGTGEVTLDASGNGHDGELIEGPKWVAGKFNKALQFDGVDDVVDFGKSKELQPDTGTVLLWFRFDGLVAVNHNQLFDKGIHSDDKGVAFYYNAA